ncbi:YqgE/AlgH family protein [Polaribacter sp. BAL334]|uniref:YqgE/AlgH family protein n=1 Tax=Polaribacter sp. BAL334 TaxID=1708178 RepID=UPI0018D26016|nr:YqgE/AlgH family protein [Polaribacter sp. BAL334]MBG7613257.1 YqgE/AlgH family protein [Polaribacter sp. BAL334]
MSYVKTLKGKLLIAEPSILNDSSFNRTIILITEHTKNNAVGFILNRPLAYTINDLLPDIFCDFTIYQGGPVEQDNLYFIHKVGNLIPESIEIGNGIFWGGNFEALKYALNNELLTEKDIRFFLGYSGWSKNQLEREIQSKSWFVSENDYENIFAINDETLWREKLLQKGGNYKLWANAPSDIQQN